ncbi:MAG: hypothetical protein CVV22_05680 [Ignavibacteriae bacterium HGW-Ignavibacteriae-1]|jgi:uncharacterized membrane protein YkvA (DUF1232 family)|nr:MAG: hypothetical protein CVV22_05680 [Ignavibacteriae bacterium HGW-Ignavibacteriae-1]
MKDIEKDILLNPEIARNYDEKSFWSKIKMNAGKWSYKILSKVFVLYHVVRDEDTPTWAKTVIYGALGYFILPLDAIPDLIPMVGYSDDLGALVAAVSIVLSHIKPKHVELSKQSLKKFFKD